MERSWLSPSGALFDGFGCGPDHSCARRSRCSPWRRSGRCGCSVVLQCEEPAPLTYRPALKEIRLPWPRQFASAEAQCATALHELVHWTGRPGPLNRSFGRRFGDAAYAFEELVAELGSAIVMGHCGLVEATVEGHAPTSTPGCRCCAATARRSSRQRGSRRKPSRSSWRARCRPLLGPGERRAHGGRRRSPARRRTRKSAR